MITRVFWPIIALCSLLTISTGAQNWPQFFGPNRDGIYVGAKLSEKWSKEGPPVVCQKRVGKGFSGPTVANGKLILFHRLGDKETIECLNAATGKPIWSFDYPTGYVDQFNFDNGPRAVPTISNRKVYTLGAEGAVNCIDLETGKNLWARDAKKEFNAPTGYFGMVCSPLVEGDAVLLNIGGQNGAGVVAFHKESGKLLWKATDQPASYSSPIAATIDGQRLALFFAGNGLVGLEPKNGKVVIDFTWKARMAASVNGATPVVVGDQIFISASYGTGANLLKLANGKLTSVWEGDNQMSNQYATSVHHAGYLYGLDGRHDFQPGAEVRCVEFATGKIMWSVKNLTPANLMLADGQLLVLAENGKLIRIKATPKEYQPTAIAQILGSDVRAYPALADGKFYARDGRKLICINLSVPTK